MIFQGMPRTARVAPGGMVFHVLNRANNQDEMFEKGEDYLAFLRVMRDTSEKKPMRILERAPQLPSKKRMIQSQSNVRRFVL